MRRMGRRTGLLVLAVLPLLLAAAAGLARAECDVTLAARVGNSQTSNEGMEYDFDVTIGTSDNCVVVHYELVIKTQSPEGEIKTTRKANHKKLHSQQQFHQIIRFWMSNKDTLMSYDPELVRCESCVTQH